MPPTSGGNDWVCAAEMRSCPMGCPRDWDTKAPRTAGDVCGWLSQDPQRAPSTMSTPPLTRSSWMRWFCAAPYATAAASARAFRCRLRCEQHHGRRRHRAGGCWLAADGWWPQRVSHFRGGTLPGGGGHVVLNRTAAVFCRCRRGFHGRRPGHRPARVWRPVCDRRGLHGRADVRPAYPDLC